MNLTYRNKATVSAQSRFRSAGFYSVDAETVDVVTATLNRRFSRGLECCAGSGEWLYRLTEICSSVDAVEKLSELTLTHPRFDNVKSHCISIEDFSECDYELVICNPPFRSYIEDEKRYLFVKLANIALDKLASGGVLVLASHPRMLKGRGGFQQLNERLSLLGVPSVVGSKDSCDFLIYGIS